MIFKDFDIWNAVIKFAWKINENFRLFFFRYREALTTELPCLGIEETNDYDQGTTKETVKSEKA